MIALFLAIVAGAAYLARDRWVWEGDLQDGLIQVNGRIECDHVTIAGELLSLVQDLLAREGTTVQLGQVLIRLDHRETLVQLAIEAADAEVAKSKAEMETALPVDKKARIYAHRFRELAA